MAVQIEESWKAHLNGEFEKPYFAQLTEAVRNEYMQTTCYPPGKLIFNAFNLCPFDMVKVVIIGQDPYHEPGQAHGLSSLTVRAHQANSHSSLGWQKFTDAAIQALAANREHLVYMLWGGYARSKAYMIDKSRNLVLESVHPSPLSANRGGWFGQHQFSRCNQYLEQNGMTPINW